MLFCGIWLNGFLEIGKNLTLNQIFFIGMAFVLLFAIILLIKTMKGFPSNFVKNCNSMRVLLKQKKLKKKKLKSIYAYSKNVSKNLYKGLKNFKNAGVGKPSDYISKEKIIDSKSSSSGFIFGFVVYIVLSVGITAFFSFSYHNNLNDGFVAGLKIPAIVFGAIFVMGLIYLGIRKAQLKNSKKALDRLVKLLDKKLAVSSDGEASSNSSEKQPDLKNSEEQEKQQNVEENVSNEAISNEFEEQTYNLDELTIDDSDLESMLDGMLSAQNKNEVLEEEKTTESGVLDLLAEDEDELESSQDIMSSLVENLLEMANQELEEKNGESFKNTNRLINTLDPNQKPKDYRPYSEEKLKEKLEELEVEFENKNEEIQVDNSLEELNSILSQSNSDENLNAEEVESVDTYENEEIDSVEETSEIPSDFTEERVDDSQEIFENVNSAENVEDLNNVSTSLEDEQDFEESEKKAYEFIDALQGESNKDDSQDSNDIISRINNDIIQILNGDRKEDVITEQDLNKYSDLLSSETEKNVENEVSEDEYYENVKNESEPELIENAFSESAENSLEEFISSEKTQFSADDDEGEISHQTDEGFENDETENIEVQSVETSNEDGFDSEFDNLSSEFDEILNNFDDFSSNTSSEKEESLQNTETQDKIDEESLTDIENQNDSAETLQNNDDLKNEDAKSSNEVETNSNAYNNRYFDNSNTFTKIETNVDLNEDGVIYEEVSSLNEPYVLNYGYEQVKQEYENRKKRKVNRPTTSQVSYLTSINVDPIAKKKAEEVKETTEKKDDEVTLTSIKTTEIKEETPIENAEDEKFENLVEEKIESDTHESEQDNDIAEIVGKFKNIQTNKGFVPESMTSFDEISSTDESVKDEKISEEMQEVEQKDSISSDDAFDTNISQDNDFDLQNIDEGFENQGFNQDINYQENSFSDFDDLFVTPRNVPKQETRTEESFDEYFNRYASKVNNPNLNPQMQNQNSYQNNGYYNNQNMPYGYNQMQNMYNQGYYPNGQNNFNQNGYFGNNMYNSNYINENMGNPNFPNNQGYPNGYYPNGYYPNNVNGFNQGYYPNNQQFMNPSNMGNPNYPNNQNFMGQPVYPNQGFMQNQNMANFNQAPTNLQNSSNIESKNNGQVNNQVNDLNKVAVEEKKEQQKDNKVANQKAPNTFEKREDVVKTETPEKKLDEDLKEKENAETIVANTVVEEQKTEVVTPEIEEVKSEKEQKQQVEEKKDLKKTEMVAEEKPSSDFKKKKIEQAEESPKAEEKKTSRGRPKSVKTTEDFVIKNDSEFEKALAKAEKLTRKKESNLSEAQAKKVENELSKLMKALNEYRNKEN